MKSKTMDPMYCAVLHCNTFQWIQQLYVQFYGEILQENKWTQCLWISQKRRKNIMIVMFWILIKIITIRQLFGNDTKPLHHIPHSSHLLYSAVYNNSYRKKAFYDSLVFCMNQIAALSLLRCFPLFPKTYCQDKYQSLAINQLALELFSSSEV